MRKFIFFMALFYATAVFSEKAQQGFYLKIVSPARINPLGSGLFVTGFYRIPLIRESGPLWESTHMDIGLFNNLSSAYESLWAYLNIEPIAIFDLTLLAGYYWTFNVLDYGIPRLPAMNSGTDYESLDGYNRGQADRGFAWKAAPRFKLTHGPAVFLHTITWNSFDFSTVGSDYIYDVTLDVRMKKTDIVLENSSYLLYKFNEHIMAGFNFYHVFVPSVKYESYRLAAIGTFNHRFSSHLDFMVALAVGPYLKHENYAIFAALQLGLTIRL